MDARSRIKNVRYATLKNWSVEKLQEVILESQKEVKKVQKKIEKEGLQNFVPRKAYPQKVYTAKNIKKATRQQLEDSIAEHKSFYHRNMDVDKIKANADRIFREAQREKRQDKVLFVDPTTVERVDRKYTKKTGKTATEITYWSDGQRVYDRYDEYGRKVFVTSAGRKLTYSKTKANERWEEINDMFDKTKTKDTDYGSKVIVFLYKMQERGQLLRTTADGKKVNADIKEVYDTFVKHETDRERLEEVADLNVFNELNAYYQDVTKRGKK